MNFSFELPNLYQNIQINKKMQKLYKEKKIIFKNNNISFDENSLFFPYLTWTGGINSCAFNFPLVLNHTLNKIEQESNKLIIILNCANIFLNQNDWLDTFGNLILQKFDNGSNLIEISDLKFMDFLKTKYPNYKYVLSPEMFLLNSEFYTADILNSLAQEDFIKSIKIPEHLSNDINFLQQLKYRNKIKIPINLCCDEKCPQYFQCKEQEHLKQLDFENSSYFTYCNNINIKNVSLKDIEEKYVPLGYSQFYLTNSISFNTEKYIEFLVNYFIKNEYRFEIYKYLKEGK